MKDDIVLTFAAENVKIARRWVAEEWIALGDKETEVAESIVSMSVHIDKYMSDVGMPQNGEISVQITNDASTAWKTFTANEWLSAKENIGSIRFVAKFLIKELHIQQRSRP